MAYRVSVMDGESETIFCAGASSATFRPRPSVNSTAWAIGSPAGGMQAAKIKLRVAKSKKLVVIRFILSKSPDHFLSIFAGGEKVGMSPCGHVQTKIPVKSDREAGFR
jgi:hypothetical protein